MAIPILTMQIKLSLTKPSFVRNCNSRPQYLTAHILLTLSTVWQKSYCSCSRPNCLHSPSHGHICSCRGYTGPPGRWTAQGCRSVRLNQDHVCSNSWYFLFIDHTSCIKTHQINRIISVSVQSLHLPQVLCSSEPSTQSSSPSQTKSNEIHSPLVTHRNSCEVHDGCAATNKTIEEFTGRVNNRA